MLKRVLCSLAFLLLTNASISLAQQAPQPPSDQAELNELIRRAAIKVKEYETGFKDLTAEEEQTVEEYDDKGNSRSNGEFLRTCSSISHNWIQPTWLSTAT